MKTIEELLEEDILRFFDEKMGSDQKKKKVIRTEEETIYEIQRDYEKDVKEALEKDNLQEAKKIFDELRVNYAKLKYSDIDKPKMFRILDNMHVQIKDYLISKRQEQNIYEEMKSMDKEVASADSVLDSNSKKQTFILEDAYNKVEQLIRENKLSEAKDAAKELIGKYNELEPANRTTQVYEHIKELLVKLQ